MYDPAQDWRDTYEISDPDGRLVEEFRNYKVPGQGILLEQK
jgi:hypothetical protein